MSLEIKDLHVSVEGREIIKGLNLSIEKGEMHALMGPNGSGKSTLSYTIMGHPKYEVTKGSIIFNGTDITGLKTSERAKLGLFLSFQHPMELQGVQLSNFLRIATNTDLREIQKFRHNLREKMDMLRMDEKFAGRSLNDGFSGGEKKRSEILQMAMLKPKIAILDEIDSGLDIDAMKIVGNGINKIKTEINPGILLITHYQRMLNFVMPDFVHIMMDGKIVKSGGRELVERLEEEGYGWLDE